MNTKITREKLNKLDEITAQIHKQEEITSELLRTAKDRYGDRVQKNVPRPDGQKADIKEKTLWDEVFFMGPGCQAGKFLRTVHPQVFASFEKQEKIAAELEKFCLVELGVDYKKMKLSDYLRLTEEIFSLLLDERVKLEGGKVKKKFRLGDILGEK